MSTLERTACDGVSGGTARVRRAARTCGDAGRAAPAGSLGALLSRTFREIRATGRSRCPVCAGVIAYTVEQALPRCGSCGTMID